MGAAGAGALGPQGKAGKTQVRVQAPEVRGAAVPALREVLPGRTALVVPDVSPRAPAHVVDAGSQEAAGRDTRAGC